MVEYLSPNWNQIYTMLLELSERIQKSSFKPDIILGIARGGWVVGRIMSDLLSNKQTANLKIEFYTDIAKTAETPRITQPVSTDVKDKRVLVCDDVSDTGKSLAVAVEYLKEKATKEIKVACLHKKSWSIFTPDFYIADTDDWIIYPWEVKETLDKIVQRMKEEGKSNQEIIEELNKTGIDPPILSYFIEILVLEK
ncbi:MAG: phosphoribosyltransferase [Candidatus Hodarchaeota archaeon]